MIDKNMLKECVLHAPLALPIINQQESIDYINKALPYSVGLEFETPDAKDFSLEDFQNIPDIMHVSCDSKEKRFRISNGIVGLVCLYNITEQLKLNCEVNEIGGIHFHIDMTDSFNKLTKSIISANENWILKELDTWEYDGDYNSRNVSHDGLDEEYSTWLKFNNQFSTAEIRIIKMSFEYDVLIPKIIHACKIIKRLKNLLIGKDHFSKIIYPELDNSEIIRYINKGSKDIDEKIEKLKDKLHQEDLGARQEFLEHQKEKKDLDRIHSIKFMKSIVQNRIKRV